MYEDVGGIEFYLKYPKFKALKDAIEEYYDNAFSPEIAVALQLVENSGIAAELIAKHAGQEAKLSGNRQQSRTTEGKRFQTNMLTIQKTFEEAFASLKLSSSYILFIDGIDIRPSSVPYGQYLDCVKGLANAVWSVNNDFFPSIKDSKGRMRAVLLLRPDIFNTLGLQNRNTKLRDNSIVLDWRTNYYNHRNSDLFKLADRMFAAQQDSHLPTGAAWDHYFPFNATNVRADETHWTSFVALMRLSFHRPRDILTVLDFAKEHYDDPAGIRPFEYKDIASSSFKRVYGDYLLGEVKNSLSFYYDEDEFELFLKFFEFLDGKQKFSYEQFSKAFSEHSEFIVAQDKLAPGFMKTADEFLQFLYDQNIICFIEHTADERFIRWCFIERSPSNISPKVKIDMDYEIHYGLANVLNTGKEIKRPRKNVRGNIGQGATRTRSASTATAPEISSAHRGLAAPTSAADPKDIIYVGIIKMYDPEKKYGYIASDVDERDVYFRRVTVDGPIRIKKGLRVLFTVTIAADGRPVATSLRQAEEG